MLYGQMTQNAAFSILDAILLGKTKINENYHETRIVLILKCGGGSDLVWLLRSADIRLLTIINGIKNTHVYQDFLKKNVTVPEEDGLCCIICA